MQLLKETKTAKFDSAYQKALVNMLYTYSWCNDKMKQLVSPYDITPQQFNVLRILRGQYPNPCTIGLLKSRMLDKMCDASRIVDRLVYKDLILKEINTYDKRAVDLVISDTGLALLQKMDKEVDLSSIVSGNLSKAEVEQLNNLLDKMRG